MNSVHAIISGLVQGVGFRYFAARQASANGITGYARNLANGEVEVLAHGDRAVLERFLADLRVGPRSAMVRGVRVSWEGSDETFGGFEIR